MHQQPVTARRPASANRLLARLPPDDYQRLLPQLETAPLEPHEILLAPDRPVRKVYFPSGGLCAITVGTADGQSSAVAMVGNEGFLGLTAWGGRPDSAHTTVVEIRGHAQVMSFHGFEQEMDRHDAFSRVVHLYARTFMDSLLQSVACSALHPIEKRCARCLLEIADRIGEGKLPVTQELLATMLGVRRASVTLAAGALHRAGLIDSGHGWIRITDRAQLEAAACECYRVVRNFFARLAR